MGCRGARLTGWSREPAAVASEPGGPVPVLRSFRETGNLWEFAGSPHRQKADKLRRHCRPEYRRKCGQRAAGDEPGEENGTRGTT